MLWIWSGLYHTPTAIQDKGAWWSQTPASSASSFFLLKLLIPMLRTRPFCTSCSMAAQVVLLLGVSAGP
jgi:hypothetical protein